MSSLVPRHLTALTRHSFSTPVKLLHSYGFLDGSFTFLDYGCGKGDDLRRVKSLGVTARGWDPYFFPKTKLICANIVNLGFVINVVEDQAERRETVQHAFSLATKLFVVSAACWNPSGIPFADGVLTTRKTFQRHFTQPELRAYVELILGETTVVMGRNIVVVIKDKKAEQRFQAGRRNAQ